MASLFLCQWRRAKTEALPHCMYVVIEGPATVLPKILYKIVQSLKFGKDSKIITKHCSLA